MANMCLLFTFIFAAVFRSPLVIVSAGGACNPTDDDSEETMALGMWARYGGECDVHWVVAGPDKNEKATITASATYNNLYQRWLLDVGSKQNSKNFDKYVQKRFGKDKMMVKSLGGRKEHKTADNVKGKAMRVVAMVGPEAQNLIERDTGRDTAPGRSPFVLKQISWKPLEDGDDIYIVKEICGGDDGQQIGDETTAKLNDAHAVLIAHKKAVRGEIIVAALRVGEKWIYMNNAGKKGQELYYAEGTEDFVKKVICKFKKKPKEEKKRGWFKKRKSKDEDEDEEDEKKKYKYFFKNDRFYIVSLELKRDSDEGKDSGSEVGDDGEEEDEEVE